MKWLGSVASSLVLCRVNLSCVSAKTESLRMGIKSLIAECDTSDKVSVKLKKTNQSCDDSFLQWEFEGFEASYDPKPSFNVLQLIKEEVPPTRRWKQLLSFLCGPPESCSHLRAEECSGFCLLTMPPMGGISKRGDTEIILTENVEQCHRSSNAYSLMNSDCSLLWKESEKQESRAGNFS